MIGKYLRQLKNAPIIYVKPSDIANHHSLNKHGFDLNGDWDNLTQTVHKGIIFKSFAQRLKGDPWESTVLYKRKKRLGKRWLRKLSIWDSMLNDIVNNGYSQRSNKEPIDEYISILIGRNGQMFIYNGIHRLVCCLLAKREEKIPVKVLLRHTQWAQFKRSCIEYSNRRGGLYAQLPHPDLESIPYIWTNERAELIASNSNYPGGTVVDIGSHWGTTSYVLAQKGFQVSAIERSKNHYRRLSKLSKFPGKPFNPMLGDFTLYDFDIDTFVMLNIAHHFIIDKVKHESFRKFLQSNDCKEIFYQAHKEDDKWSPYMKPEEMLDFILTNSKKHSFRMLKDFNGRKLYHLS